MAHVEDKSILVDATAEAVSLRLIGHIGEELAERLMSYLSTVGEGRDLAVDLSQCEHLHRKALAVLVTHALQMKKAGKRVQLFSPTPAVLKTLNDFQIPQLMAIRSSGMPVETANLRAVGPSQLPPNELPINTRLAEDNLELLRTTAMAELPRIAERAVVPPAWKDSSVAESQNPFVISRELSETLTLARKSEMLRRGDVDPTELTTDIVRAIFIVCVVSALYGITMLVGTRLGFLIFFGSSMIAYEAFIVYRAINKSR